MLKFLLTLVLHLTLFSMLPVKATVHTWVTPRLVKYEIITTGAMQTAVYFPLLNGKSVAVVTNQTGIIGDQHLVDIMLEDGLHIAKIFTPEHGFRGDHDAGAWVGDMRDPVTGLKIVSLYGSNKKPKKEDLSDVDIIVFDLQDVGARFYTYISTLTYVMEAAAENQIPLVVLDRPNPNGFYVDGPVLEPRHRSFVGLHPVPVVYGMTIGEYALMVNGEGWLTNRARCQLTVVPLKGYERDMVFQLPVRPSPNLPDWKAVYLYPSLCFFEGTVVSVGRGTHFPFKVYGHPDLPKGNFSFTPVSMPGFSLNPPHMYMLCHGEDLSPFAEQYALNKPGLELKWLINTYNHLKGKHQFFNNYFDTLAGTTKLREQIMAGKSTDNIRKSWHDALQQFMKIRAKYLLYPDFAD